MFSKKAPDDVANVEIGPDFVKDLVARQDIINKTSELQRQEFELGNAVIEAQIAKELNTHKDFTYNKRSLMELKKETIMS